MAIFLIFLLNLLDLLWNLRIDSESRICCHPFELLIICNLLIVHLFDVFLEVLYGPMQAFLLNRKLMPKFLLH